MTASSASSGELDTNEFVEAFMPVLASDAGDVSLLFMKIDANCDGTVSWEEFLSYILSQDEGALQIETESSRQLFDYPSVTDTTSQVQGHKDTAAGLIVLEDADRYISYSRKGDLLVWKPDGIEGLKVQHPREFQTDLPFITGLVHAKRLSHSDRLAVCSADKQVIFIDLMRDSCKLSGTVKLDISPLCMCTVVLRDEGGDERERMLAFGDDGGMVHMYDLDKVGTAAERNLMASNARKAQEGHIRSWKAHDNHAWISKVEYVDDLRVLISCASDGQIVLNDVDKGEVKVDGLKHRCALTAKNRPL
jgi:WD40 repeat protein